MLGKLALLLGSFALSLALIESSLRVVFEPVDYLKPDIAGDPVLGWRIAPGSGGHDAWGFRNPRVPETADVVAIGDSQTYGYAARADESWPSWYARFSGREVYNLGIGGYGPAEYLHLLETKALLLEPELVIVGLYYGNDFYDAQQSVIKRDHWASLRARVAKSPETAVAANEPGPAASGEEPEETWFIVARDWLRRRSMIFRVLEEGPVGQTINALGDRGRTERRGECVVVPEQPFSTVFMPQERFSAMDPSDPGIVAGIDLSLTFLARMAAIAERAGAELLVVLIPTKEAALTRAADAPGTGCGAVLRRLVESEERIGRQVKAFLDDRGIGFVDPLEALRSAALEERTYLRSGDSHPNGTGYRVIAKQVARHLEQRLDRAGS